MRAVVIPASYRTILPLQSRVGPYMRSPCCVTLHSYHCYVEQGLPKTQVFLWVYGQELRAVFDNVVLAEYYCSYDLRAHKVTNIRDGRFPPTRFPSAQGTLIPRHPQDSLILIVL